MIVSCVSALTLFITSMTNAAQDISYEIKTCTFNTETGRSWIVLKWKFDEKRYAGTSGKTTVNHLALSTCVIPKSREFVYVDKNKKYSAKEEAFVTVYGPYLKNYLRFFASNFCFQARNGK